MMNKIKQAQFKHNQHKIIEFCRDNKMSIEQLQRTAELMLYVELREKNNLLRNENRISLMEMRGDYV